MQKVHLDFETFSEVDVNEVGAARYAEHPSTEILSLKYRIGDQKTRHWTPYDLFPPEDLMEAVEQGLLFTAHNAFFERCIWEKICVPLLGWKPIPLEQWRCTAAKASAMGLPRSLEGLGKALRLSVIKDTEGKRVMQKLSKPRKPTKNNPATRWTPDTAPEDFQTLYGYNDTDVEAEHAADVVIKDLSPYEQQVWFCDQRINSRGVRIDVELAKAAIRVRDELIQRMNIELEQITNGFVTAGSQRNRILEWVNRQTLFPLPDLTADTVAEALASDNYDDKTLRVIKIRQATSRTSTAKFDAMLRCLCSDGCLRDILMYHAASTGRFGGKFVQTQNLKRGVKNADKIIEAVKMNDAELLEMLYDDPIEAISYCIRGAFIAREGHRLLVADYAAIEARVLLWIAGDERALELFRSGKDIYKDMASSVYKVPFENVTSDQRQMGKQAILGLGYQMGADKFADTCLKYGISVTSEFAQQVVETYRTKYSRVKRMWRTMENAAIHAVRTGKPTACHKVIWFTHGQGDHKFLYCKLPSGRTMAYCRPTLKTVMTKWGQEKCMLHFEGVDSETKQWVRQSTYGGKLVENVVQAIARDLLVEALLNVEAAGYPVLFHTHDEIVAEKPIGQGSLDELIRLMVKLPKWAEGCPVSAEGWEGVRYRK